jgi:hypothetical protein
MDDFGGYLPWLLLALGGAITASLLLYGLGYPVDLQELKSALSSLASALPNDLHCVGPVQHQVALDRRSSDIELLSRSQNERFFPVGRFR